MEPRTLLYFLAAFLLIAVPRAEARLLLSQKQALALAFDPSLTVERKTAYLSMEQAERAQREGLVKIDSRVWTYYVGSSSRGVEGYAYFDTHVVRTMPETFMAALDSDGRVRFVELLSFLEPPDYEPKPRWLDQFDGKKLEEDLMVRRAIRNITGASLTSQKLTDGIRRILAIHSLLHGEKGRIAP